MHENVIPETKGDDAQHAIITGVKLLRKDDGRIYFIVKIASRDIHYVATLDIQIPTGFEEGMLQGSNFDPATLPEDDENGRQQTMFRKNIGNRRFDAWLQRLVFNLDSLARKNGRDPAKVELVMPMKCLEDYAHNLHVMLTGVECILLRKGGEVWDVIEDQDYRIIDKKMAGYKLLWEKD